MSATRNLAYAALTLLVCSWSAGLAAGPKIQSWQTSNGARVMFVEAPEINMFDVRVTFAAGSARDDAQPGLAHLTSKLLTEGAGDRDADAFSAALGATGAMLSTGARRDMAYLGLRTLAEKKYAEPALGLMTDAMAKPRFDDGALARTKARATVALERKKQSPGALAEETFYARVYPEHPYGSPPDGTAVGIDAITRDNIVAFHKRYYVARNAVIAITGRLDRARAAAIGEQLAGALPAGEPAPALPAVPATTATTAHVEFPSIQSHVRVGLPGMSRTDPDYFPLLVGNHALGGNALVSILFDEIRDKRGLSYSAYSYFLPMAERGPFVAAMQTDRSRQDEAMQVLAETIRRFVTEGPPAPALDAAKKNLIGGFPLRVDANNKINEYLAMIGFYDLPLDYLDQFVDRVAAVSAADVRDAFSRRVQLDQLVTVVVGRADAGDHP